MFIKRIHTSSSLYEHFKDLGVDSGGLKILSQKSETLYFYIKDLHVGAANILKQDALSIGADLAVPKGTVLASTPKVDAILIGTLRHMYELSRKELAQPFGLKSVAQSIKKHLDTNSKVEPQIMGIINANDDSFFEGSRFLKAEAIEKILQMIEEGATIIDIGAVSSRPGAAIVTEEEELLRFKPIADSIKEKKLFERVTFSIDSYTPSVVEYALESGFSIVNDIRGLQDEAICALVAKYNATAVIMHMKGTPQTMQDKPEYDDVVEEVEHFFIQQIQKAHRFGIEKIILDVGIGFGKTLEHNIELLSYLSHFKALGFPLLVGASRKSMIDTLSPSKVEDRLAGSLILHVKSVENGASILRVHDVYEHTQALAVHKAINNPHG